MQIAKLLSAIQDPLLRNNLSRDLQDSGSVTLTKFRELLFKYTTKASIVYLSDVDRIRFSPNTKYLDIYKNIQKLVLKSLKYDNMPTDRTALDIIVATQFKKKVPKDIRTNPAFLTTTKNNEDIALLAEQLSASLKLADDNLTQFNQLNRHIANKHSKQSRQKPNFTKHNPLNRMNRQMIPSHVDPRLINNFFNRENFINRSNFNTRFRYDNRNSVRPQNQGNRQNINRQIQNQRNINVHKNKPIRAHDNQFRQHIFDNTRNNNRNTYGNSPNKGTNRPPADTGNRSPGKTCYKCGRPGHFANSCFARPVGSNTRNRMQNSIVIEQPTYPQPLPNFIPGHWDTRIVQDSNPIFWNNYLDTPNDNFDAYYDYYNNFDYLNMAHNTIFTNNHHLVTKSRPANLVTCTISLTSYDSNLNQNIIQLDNALIDSGSQITLASLALFKKLQFPILTLDNPVELSNALDASFSAVHHFTMVSITFDTNTTVTQVTIYLTTDPVRYSVIIGIDVLHNLTVTLTDRPKILIALSPIPSHPIQINSICPLSSHNNFDILARKRYTILPGESKIIKTKIQRNYE